MGKSKGSLRNKMTAFFGIIILIACVVLAVVSAYRASAIVEKEAQEAMLRTAKQAADTVDSRLKARIYIVESLANRSVIRGFDGGHEATLQEKLTILKDEQNMAASWGFKRFGIVDKSGIATYPDGSTADLSARDYIQAALGGKTAVSSTIISKVDNSVVFGVAAPIRSYGTGQVVGAVVGIIDAEKLSQLVANVTYGQSGYGFAVDSTGKTIAHKDLSKVTSQENIIEAAQKDQGLASLASVVSKMAQGKTGFGTYQYKGTEKFIAYAPVKSTGWSIGVTAPKSEVLAQTGSLARDLVLVSIAIIILALIGIYLMARNLTAPIIYMTSTIKRFSEYDFTFDESDKTFNYLKRQDEIGLIANALAEMQANIISLIKILVNDAQTLAGNSETLSATSEEIASSAGEVANAIQQVAAGAGEQANHLQDILLLVEDITKSLDQVYIELGHVKDNSEETSRLANVGKKELDVLVTSIRNVREAFNLVVEKLTNLSGSVTQIGEILQVINGIAEQTNLLALNAAIEAARAGEAGRGFAVVAEEVRKLAEQSRSSSDDIRALLNTIGSETEEVVHTSEEVSRQVVSQLANVEKTVTSFDQILDSVASIAPMIEATYREVDSTVKAKNVMLERVQNISAVAQETSASAEEISASAEELTAATQEIAANAQQVLDVAQRMEEQVGKFKV